MGAKKGITVYLDEELFKRFSVVSRLLGRSKTDILNEALKKTLDSLEPEARLMVKVMGKSLDIGN